jgi:hypothetical protein
MSRYGSLSGGRKKLLSEYSDFKSTSSLQADTPTSPVTLDYTSGKGVWNLNSTTQFPKNVNRAISLGLTPGLLKVKDTNNAWTQITVDISRYANRSVRVVFRYINDRSGELGDIQLDLINLDGNSYSFENVGHSFETSTTDVKTYSSVAWTAISVATTTGRWNVDTGGTPTASTSRTDAASGTYYVYAETSSPGNSKDYNFWLRSPTINLSGSPTLSFYEARNGSTIGELYVYLELLT